MVKKLFYNVQVFEKVGGKLRQGRLRQFKTPEEATRSGEVLADKNAGVLVYSIYGDTDADDWDDPILITSHGETPATSE